MQRTRGSRQEANNQKLKKCIDLDKYRDYLHRLRQFHYCDWSEDLVSKIIKTNLIEYVNLKHRHRHRRLYYLSHHHQLRTVSSFDSNHPTRPYLSCSTSIFWYTPLILFYPTHLTQCHLFRTTLPYLSNSTPPVLLYPTRFIMSHWFHSTSPNLLYPDHLNLSHPSHSTPPILLHFTYPFLLYRSHSTPSNIQTQTKTTNKNKKITPSSTTSTQYK